MYIFSRHSSPWPALQSLLPRTRRACPISKHSFDAAHWLLSPTNTCAVWTSSSPNNRPSHRVITWLLMSKRSPSQSWRSSSSHLLVAMSIHWTQFPLNSSNHSPIYNDSASVWSTVKWSNKLCNATTRWTDCCTWLCSRLLITHTLHSDSVSNTLIVKWTDY